MLNILNFAANQMYNASELELAVCYGFSIGVEKKRSSLDTEMPERRHTSTTSRG